MLIIEYRYNLYTSTLLVKDFVDRLVFGDYTLALGLGTFFFEKSMNNRQL
jgi:hypothetical protein